MVLRRARLPSAPWSPFAHCVRCLLSACSVPRTGLCVCARQRQRSPQHVHAGVLPPLRGDLVDRFGHLGDGGATTSSRCRAADTLLVHSAARCWPGVPSMPHNHRHATGATQHARTRPPLSICLRRRDGCPPPIQISSCAAHLGVRRALRERSFSRAARTVRDPRGCLQSSCLS